MSPRRKFQPGEESLLVAASVQQRQRRWRLPLAGAVVGVLMAAAITVSALMLISHQSRQRSESREHEVRSYVAWFMTGFTSIDPFHANEYITRVLAQATGEFGRQYHDQANEILLQIARAEPASGTVLDTGVERWNDDGTINVMVVTAVTSKSPDEKQVFEATNRWMATVTQEGNQWKISNLLQVI